MVIIGGICGKEFEGVGNKRYCSEECRKVANLKANKESYERNKGHYIKNTRPKKRKKRKSQLAELSKEAKLLGVSYGQYQAMKYLEGLKEL